MFSNDSPFSVRTARKHVLFGAKRRALSAIVSAASDGSITAEEAELLKRYVAATFVAGRLQVDLERPIAGVCRKAQRLEQKISHTLRESKE